MDQDLLLEIDKLVDECNTHYIKSLAKQLMLYVCIQGLAKSRIQQKIILSFSFLVFEIQKHNLQNLRV